MKAFYRAGLVSALLSGCGPAVVPPPVPVVAPQQPTKLEEGREAILWDEDKTVTTMLIGVGRGVVSGSVGDRVIYLGSFPGRREGDPDRARIRMLEGEGKGSTGIIPVENLKPLPH